jgi:DHA1 family bicyclomycin/chloramphenicol resistance-like MFS transporter
VSPVTAQDGASRRGLTLLLGALIAIAPLAMDIYLASMPAMTRVMQASTAQVQATLSVYMVGWGLAQLVAGPASDRFGRRPVLLSGLVLFILASLACSLARTIDQLILFRFFQALGMAGAAVVPRAVVRDLYAGVQAARMLSLMGVVLGIAPIVAPILGSHLHVWFGWPSSFVFVAVYGFVVCALAARALPETLAVPDPRALDPRRIAANFAMLARTRDFTGYALVAAFSTAGLFAFLSGSAFVFVSVMQSGETGFGLLFAMVMTGNITGAYLGSRLVLRYGIDGLLRRSTGLLLASSLVLALLAWLRIDHPAAVVVPMFFYMVAFTCSMPQAAAGALGPHPEIAGASSSLLSCVQFATAAVSGLAVGLSFDGTQRPMATVIAVFAVAAFAAFRWLRPGAGAQASP